MGLNAYGFPTLFWQTNLTREEVEQASPLGKDGGTFNARVEEENVPILTPQLTPGARIRFDYWTGEDGKAQQRFQDLWKIDRSLTGAAHLLPKLARPDDLPWLAEVQAQAPTESVKAFASVAAAKIAPQNPISGFRQSKREPYTLPMELLAVAVPPCNGTVRDYIVGLLGKVPSKTTAQLASMQPCAWAATLGRIADDVNLQLRSLRGGRRCRLCRFPGVCER